MRITQNMMTRNYLRNMNNNLSRLSKSQDRMIGQKYNKGAENVAETSRALRVRQTIYDDEQYLLNIRDAQGRLSSAESNLMSINDILVTAREQLMKKSLNDANGGERDIIASQIDSMADEILQFSNSQFSNNFLFGGTNNGGEPFNYDAETGVLTFNGINVNSIFKQDGKYYYFADPQDPNSKTAVPEGDQAYFDVGLGLTLSQDQVDARSAFKITFNGLDALSFGTEDGMPNNVALMLKEAAKMLRADSFDRDRMDLLCTRLKGRTEQLMLNITDIGSKTDFLDKTAERLDNDIYNLTALQQKLEVTDTAQESINWKTYSAVMMATYQFGAQVLPASLMDFIQ